ncbi:MAG: DUF58 domain-containing protein [Bacteroidales bacterium]|nr:DUF58 domain-containing protein [Bacteroidales bacterium]HOY38066.1 DUF58 domain-containing protein [Bacteroidales bacterium]HQP03608.1 DUF58 domain-containing protein [Bacteroidales bacterium]
METAELLKRVRRIEIKTKGLSNQIFAGEYHSAFKGKGMAFSEVREYMYGDPIKHIDWHVTARFNHPYVKVFEEEREMTAILLIDVSGSGQFGTHTQLKQYLAAEIAAVISFSVIQNNDKIGVVFFSDNVEKFIPPKKGKKHILHIIRELLNFEPQNKQTNISEALRFLTNAIKKRSTTFIISDFISPDYSDALKIASRKHDVVALRLFDRREAELTDIGLVQVCDNETNEIKWIDTSSARVRKQYNSWWLRHDKICRETLTKCGVDFVSIATGDDYIKPLISLFKNR